jgi:Xaa-Pro aminopeptidase
MSTKKYHFIGIRIEDDVLVTKDGHDVLTDGAPKEIDDIEALMAAAN